MLATFSFYYTFKTTTVIKNTDEIMKYIEEASKEKVYPIDAYIDGDMVIPGLKGSEVDISKSYDVMKKIGTYSSNMLVYKKISPNISITKIYNKYIQEGNPKKNNVTLIFKIDDKTYLDNIITILDKYDIKANFFFNDYYDEDIKLSNKGHIIGYIINDTWANILVNKTSNQKNIYCYLEDKNIETLNMCSMNKAHTIIPSIKVTTNPTITIKKNLKSGSIISLNVDKAISELEYIIRYIKSKGYNIVNLDTLLEE